MSLDVADEEDAGNLSRKREALRLGLAVSFCFILAEVFNWDVTFLGPMLAAQLLVKLRQRPPLVQGIGIVVIISVAMAGVFFMSASLVSNPFSLLLCLGLLHYFVFYAHLRGAPEFTTLMLQIAGVAMPVFVVVSPAIASDLAVTLIVAGAVAIATVWTAFAVFPNPDKTEEPVLPQKYETTNTMLRFALERTAILMPVLAWFVLDASQNTLVVLIAIVTLLRVVDPRSGWKTATALILANLIGGIMAIIAYVVIDISGSLPVFVTVTLGMSLIFAGRIVTARDLAPVFAVAFTTFILLLGSGLSPLPGGTEEVAFSRLINVMIATVYAASILTLFQSWRDGRLKMSLRQWRS
jgi:hypothetical protein